MRPLSEVLTEVIGRTGTLVDQGTLTTSLWTYVECMLEDRTGRGHDLADLLNEGAGIFYDTHTGMYNGI